MDGKPQAFGSATTYGRRYVESAVLGIASEVDDDGNEDSGLSQGVSHEQRKRKISPKQKELLLKLVDDVPAMLNYYGIEKVEDLTIEQASQIIAKKKEGK